MKWFVKVGRGGPMSNIFVDTELLRRLEWRELADTTKGAPVLMLSA